MKVYRVPILDLANRQRGQNWAIQVGRFHFAAHWWKRSDLPGPASLLFFAKQTLQAPPRTRINIRIGRLLLGAAIVTERHGLD